MSYKREEKRYKFKKKFLTTKKCIKKSKYISIEVKRIIKKTKNMQYLKYELFKYTYKKIVEEYKTCHLY
jgi:hypothetical protein